jgi:hypothetical protein
MNSKGLFHLEKKTENAKETTLKRCFLEILIFIFNGFFIFSPVLQHLQKISIFMVFCISQMK